MTDSAELLIASQALELIANIAPRIVPATTLSVQANANATSITVADATGWLEGDIVTFWDGSGEAPLTIPVGGITGNVITLSFAGQSYSGLQYTHSAGALVAVAIIDDMPLDTADMRKSGWPVISTFVVRGKTPGPPTMGSYQNHPTLQINYQLRIRQSRESLLPEQLWARQQTHRVTNDLKSIIDTLWKNRKLSTPTRPAVTIGIENIDWGFTDATKQDSEYYFGVALVVRFAGGLSKFQ